MQPKHEDLEKAYLVKAIIEKEYYKPCRVIDLAQRVGTNKSSLNLAFRLISGMPVKKFIKHLRIEKAKDLLETTGNPVEIIASRVGLHRTNLERNFKKLYGKSPRAWRMTSD
jgi:AraC-like DNA-binding protein